MKVSRIGLDLAKKVFQVHAVDRAGNVLVRRQVKRAGLLEFFATLAREEACEVGMEATGGAHYWARELARLGYVPRLMNPKFVVPYRRGNKTDRNDAAAIAEAMHRPGMSCVSPRTLKAQDMMMLHRVRERLVKNRTALVNQTRGWLTEYGVTMARSVSAFRRAAATLLDPADTRLTPTAREALAQSLDELRALEARGREMDRHIAQLASSDPRCVRLMAVEGIGPLTATAVVARIGNGQQFARGRQFAAYLGLTPGEASSGGKVKRLGITKRGDRYLRTLFVHGARACLQAAQRRPHPRAQWARAIQERAHKNTGIVALAAKQARIAWALLAHDTEYRRPAAAE